MMMMVGIVEELRPVMSRTTPSLYVSYLMYQLTVDLHYPETVFEAVLLHHPFPDCVLGMSDLGAMLHHLLPHSQNEYCVTLAVHEVHHSGFAWSPY
jgi:hypothetical protein